MHMDCLPSFVRLFQGCSSQLDPSLGFNPLSCFQSVSIICQVRKTPENGEFLIRLRVWMDQTFGIYFLKKELNDGLIIEIVGARFMSTN